MSVQQRSGKRFACKQSGPYIRSGRQLYGPEKFQYCSLLLVAENLPAPQLDELNIQNGPNTSVSIRTHCMHTATDCKQGLEWNHHFTILNSYLNEIADQFLYFPASPSHRVSVGLFFVASDLPFNFVQRCDLNRSPASHFIVNTKCGSFAHILGI